MKKWIIVGVIVIVAITLSVTIYRYYANNTTKNKSTNKRIAHPTPWHTKDNIVYDNNGIRVY